ncbi:MAG: S-methyl-5-thioribose-1-phosphate isomerase [Euryarchaeota archaeon]|nr:S-methyl-5-thioribose-1-phosphate isomerase [Euryarchaeota archaeon]
MRTIWWDDGIRMIDQARLPAELVTIKIETVQDLCEAILTLRIRGAPALGAAGAYGVALAAICSRSIAPEDLLRDLDRAGDIIKSTRPTAVNLSWGVDRVRKAVAGADDADADEIRDTALKEAERVADEDVAVNRALGDIGAELLDDGDVVLTHCNAGRLACVDWGTALGVIRSAVAHGKDIRVYACETRPLNQGSRLTAWELMEDKIPVTLICDSMAGMVMRQGLVNKVIVGADRITCDAVFNKVGTYAHAVLAKEHGIPFYVAAPLSTFDLGRKEEEIVIEERDPDEVRWAGGVRLAPSKGKVYNPAFDATPLDKVTGIITEKGILGRSDMVRGLVTTQLPK